jgi:hypothetical protein
MTLNDLPNLLSTFTVLIPLVIAIAGFHKLNAIISKLMLFLTWSFIVDLKRWYIPSDYFMHLYFLYAITEIIFFLWFLDALFPAKRPRTYTLVATVASIVLWICCFVIFQKGPGNNWLDSLFDSCTSAMLAITAAYHLFHLTKEPDRMESQPRFWFALGVFLYFFCSNFIFSLVSFDIARHIWIIPITMNITTYFIFSIGFWIAIREKSKKGQLVYR